MRDPTDVHRSCVGGFDCYQCGRCSACDPRQVAAKAILLVPKEGDPMGLLKGGPCGAMPPIMEDHRHNGGPPCWDDRCSRRSQDLRDNRLALVLAREGKPVRSGIFQLGDEPSSKTHDVRTIGGMVRRILDGEPLATMGVSVRALEHYGTLILLDENGAEGSS